MGERPNTSRFAKKSLGQNFLVDGNYVQRIVDALDLESSDTVIEIGPGRAAITERLVKSGASVIAIELDRELVPELQQRFASDENFSIVEADATRVNFSDLVGDRRAKVVANLPYYISTPILQHLSGQRQLFERLLLMFQKEVVDRITARPGDSERGFLTVLVESAFEVEKLFDVPSNAFRPVPKVTSSVAKFVPKPVSAGEDEASFREIVSIAFGQKRKTLANNLKARFPAIADSLDHCHIETRRRAETLTIEEWQRLVKALQ